MSLRFLRLDSLAGRIVRPQTRKSDRQFASREIEVLSSTGESAPARLHDVSPYGCNVRASAPWLRLGRFVTLKCDADITVQAIVRWSRDDATGLEFLRPLPEQQIAEFAGLAD